MGSQKSKRLRFVILGLIALGMIISTSWAKSDVYLKIERGTCLRARAPQFCLNTLSGNGSYVTRLPAMIILDKGNVFYMFDVTLEIEGLSLDFFSQRLNHLEFNEHLSFYNVSGKTLEDLISTPYYGASVRTLSIFQGLPSLNVRMALNSDRVFLADTGIGLFQMGWGLFSQLKISILPVNQEEYLQRKDIEI